MRGLVVVGVALLVLTGPKSALAQDATSLIPKLSQAWEICVGRTARSFYDAGQNKSLAVENAFLACQTEEQAIFAAMYAVPRDQLAQAQILHRLRVKRSLVGE